MTSSLCSGKIRMIVEDYLEEKQDKFRFDTI